MLRIVGVAGHGLALNTGRNRTGRGGYLHRDEECWTRFAGRKGMVRSLGVSVDRAARATLVGRLRPQLHQ